VAQLTNSNRRQQQLLVLQVVLVTGLLQTQLVATGSLLLLGLVLLLLWVLVRAALVAGVAVVVIKCLSAVAAWTVMQACSPQLLTTQQAAAHVQIPVLLLTNHLCSHQGAALQ
jgi:hypothetical protein